MYIGISLVLCSSMFYFCIHFYLYCSMILFLTPPPTFTKSIYTPLHKHIEFKALKLLGCVIFIVLPCFKSHQLSYQNLLWMQKRWFPRNNHINIITSLKNNSHLKETIAIHALLKKRYDEDHTRVPITTSQTHMKSTPSHNDLPPQAYIIYFIPTCLNHHNSNLTLGHHPLSILCRLFL